MCVNRFVNPYAFREKYILVFGFSKIRMGRGAEGREFGKLFVWQVVTKPYIVNHSSKKFVGIFFPSVKL